MNNLSTFESVLAFRRNKKVVRNVVLLCREVAVEFVVATSLDCFGYVDFRLRSRSIGFDNPVRGLDVVDGLDGTERGYQRLLLHSLRKLFKTTSFNHLSSPEIDLFSYHEEQLEEEITKTMTEPTMEEYMTKTREDYRPGIARPKFDKDAKFELKGQFLKELRDHTFSGSEIEDANVPIERVC
ncbi:hypothetical protein Tco_0685187 [Tanacetum coccineum]